MIVKLQSENIDISSFEIAVDFFTSALVDASNFLLNKLVQRIDAQEIKLQKNFLYYKENTYLLLDNKKIDKEYNSLEKASDTYKILLDKVETYKDESEAFMNLYNAIDKYYTSLCNIPIEIGFLEAKMIQDGEMQSAS